MTLSIEELRLLREALVCALVLKRDGTNSIDGSVSDYESLAGKVMDQIQDVKFDNDNNPILGAAI